MQPSESDESEVDGSWRHLCFLYIGRRAALTKYLADNAPDVIIENQNRLIQEALKKMEDACFADSIFLAGWGKILDSRRS